jgi:hypothetical protein
LNEFEFLLSFDDLRLGTRQEKIGEGLDDGEGLIQLVGDAAGQFSEGGELLRLVEAVSRSDELLTLSTEVLD